MSTGIVVWFTGLPASGKSTLARAVRDGLIGDGRHCCLLDGDEVRAVIVPQPGYTEKDRSNFYSTLGNLAGLLAGQGLIVLVPATASRRVFRSHARNKAPAFLEVYVDTPQEICAQRDDKGLQTLAAQSPQNTVPGRGSVYEPPVSPDMVISVRPVADPVAQIVRAIDGLK